MSKAEKHKLKREKRKEKKRIEREAAAGVDAGAATREARQQEKYKKVGPRPKRPYLKDGESEEQKKKKIEDYAKEEREWQKKATQEGLPFLKLCMQWRKRRCFLGKGCPRAHQIHQQSPLSQQRSHRQQIETSRRAATFCPLILWPPSV